MPVVAVAVMVIVQLPENVSAQLAPKNGLLAVLVVADTRANPKVLLLSTTPAPALEATGVVIVLLYFTVNKPPPLIVSTFAPKLMPFAPLNVRVLALLPRFHVWLPPSDKGAAKVRF